jgi:hypothetical protein
MTMRVVSASTKFKSTTRMNPLETFSKDSRRLEILRKDKKSFGDVRKGQESIW